MTSSIEITNQGVSDVQCDDTTITVTLVNKTTIWAALAEYPRLRDASPEQRSNWQISSGGFGIHWPAIDEDLSIERLANDAVWTEFSRETAAQLAEQANVERDVDPATASTEYLDGYQAGYEKAAAIIRRGRPL